MDLENKIQNLFTEQNTEIDTDQFLTKLHNTREKRQRNKQRLTYGITSFAIVLLVGIISITQLNNIPIDVNSDYYYSSGEMSEDLIDEYYDDLMIYLADQSDDVWSTMELYYATNNDNINGE